MVEALGQDLQGATSPQALARQKGSVSHPGALCSLPPRTAALEGPGAASPVIQHGFCLRGATEYRSIALSEVRHEGPQKGLPASQPDVPSDLPSGLPGVPVPPLPALWTDAVDLASPRLQMRLYRETAVAARDGGGFIYCCGECWAFGHCCVFLCTGCH